MASKVTIIHVEDDPAHAQLVARGFDNIDLDLNLILLTDGQAILDYLDNPRNPAPQMILLDLNLPKVSGVEVLKQIRSSERHFGIPVVILSTSSAESDIKDAYQHCANSYLVKPLDFINFQAMIQDCGAYWGNWNQTGLLSSQ